MCVQFHFQSWGSFGGSLRVGDAIICRLSPEYPFYERSSNDEHFPVSSKQRGRVGNQDIDDVPVGKVSWATESEVLTDMKSAPNIERRRILLRPSMSLRWLSQPVVIALRILSVVLTAVERVSLMQARAVD